MTFAFSIAVSVFGTEAGKVMLHRAIHRVLRVSRLVVHFGGSVVAAKVIFVLCVKRRVFGSVPTSPMMLTPYLLLGTDVVL